MLIFITSLRHPQNASSWDHVLDLLDRTLKSVCNQTAPDFKIILVYNKGSRLRSYPPQVILHPVNLPPNPLFEQASSTEESRNAVRLDKGQKYLAGLFRAREFTGAQPSTYVTFFDADDCVNLRLVEFVNRSPHHNGWYIDSGYLHREGDRFAYSLQANFWRICGTCYVIRYDLFHLPQQMEDVSEEYIQRALGSHIFIKDMLAEQGTPLAPLPFSGAVYVIGHGANHAKIPGYRTLIDGYDAGTYTVRGTLRTLSRFRLLTKSLRREFGLYPIQHL